MTCFDCVYSSSNPAWLDVPRLAWRFNPRARREFLLSCWRHPGNSVRGHEICDGFVDRATVDIPYAVLDREREEVVI